MATINTTKNSRCNRETQETKITKLTQIQARCLESNRVDCITIMERRNESLRQQDCQDIWGRIVLLSSSKGLGWLCSKAELERIDGGDFEFGRKLIGWRLKSNLVMNRKVIDYIRWMTAGMRDFRRDVSSDREYEDGGTILQLSYENEQSPAELCMNKDELLYARKLATPFLSEFEISILDKAIENPEAQFNSKALCIAMNGRECPKSKSAIAARTAGIRRKMRKAANLEKVDLKA